MSDFDTILDECIARIIEGEDLVNCEADYPDVADEILPLLEVGQQLQHVSIPRPSSDAVIMGQERMLSALSARKNGHSSIKSGLPVSFPAFLRYAGQKLRVPKPKEVWNMKLVTRFAIAVVGLFLLGSVAAVQASAQSLPGDTLYPVKLAWEDVQLSLTKDEATLQKLTEQFRAERQMELAALLAEGRSAKLEITGVLESVGDGFLVVDGVTFLVDETTGVDPNMQKDCGYIWAEVETPGQQHQVQNQTQFKNTNPEEKPLVNRYGCLDDAVPAGPNQDPDGSQDGTGEQNGQGQNGNQTGGTDGDGSKTQKQQGDANQQNGDGQPNNNGQGDQNKYGNPPGPNEDSNPQGGHDVNEGQKGTPRQGQDGEEEDDASVSPETLTEGEEPGGEGEAAKEETKTGPEGVPEDVEHGDDPGPGPDEDANQSGVPEDKDPGGDVEDDADPGPAEDPCQAGGDETDCGGDNTDNGDVGSGSSSGNKP